MRGPLRWTLTTGAFLALWLLLVLSTRWEEVLIGLGASALAAGALAAVRHESSLRFAPRLRWLAPVVNAPWEVVRDSGLLLGVLVRAIVLRRPVSGRLRPLRFDGGGASHGRSVARRALATWLGSLGPNSIVLDFDLEHDVVLVHELVPAPEPPAGIRDLARA